MGSPFSPNSTTSPPRCPTAHCAYPTPVADAGRPARNREPRPLAGRNC
jgi:hypothetical protein